MGLEVIDLYQKTNSKSTRSFLDKIDSNLNVKSDYEKVDSNLEWLTKMEDTIYYL